MTANESTSLLASDEIRVLSVGPSRALLVSLGAPHEMISWAIVNGGRRRADAVVWRQVQRFAPLSEEALLEACALAAEAKTAAVLEARVPSSVSGRPATGTGTDCNVIAAPVAAGDVTSFARKHTRCGSAVGAAVYEAVARGVRAWLEENESWPRT